MSLTLTLELSPAAAENLERQAEAAGVPAAQLAAANLERAFGRAPDTRTEAEKQAARDRFNRHIGALPPPDPTGSLRELFGSVSLPGPSGADNESIDADLAREYMDDHENCPCCSTPPGSSV